MLTTQEDLDAALSSLRASPDPIKVELATQVLTSVRDMDARKLAVVAGFQTLPATQQNEAASVLGLSTPTTAIVDRLWILIVGALIVLIFFLFILVTLNSTGLSTVLELVKSTISLSLGAIIGLVAPGAVKSKP